MLERAGDCPSSTTVLYNMRAFATYETNNPTEKLPGPIIMFTRATWGELSKERRGISIEVVRPQAFETLDPLLTAPGNARRLI